MRLSKDHPQRDRILLCGLVVVTVVALWCALPTQFQANQSYDYVCCYETAARNSLAGKGFVYNNGVFASAYPPGFSLLLVGVFSIGKWIGEGLALRLFIILCDTGTVLVAYSMGRALGGPWLGRLYGIGLISYPFFLWMSKQPNSELPFLPLVLCGFYTYMRLVTDRHNLPWKWAALSGFCWALAALIRPIAVFGPFVIVACIALFDKNHKQSRRMILAGILVLVNVVTMAPWEIIAKKATGRWILSGDNSGVGYVDGLTFGLPAFMNNPAQVDADVGGLMERAAGQLDRIRTTGGYLSFLKEEAQHHPGAFVKIMIIKILRAWYATYEGYFEGINKMISLVYVATACVGLWWMWKTHAAVARGIIALVLYFWGMSVLVLPILRYMVPATALLILPVAFLVQKSMEARIPSVAADGTSDAWREGSKKHF
jgi:4-amino-4-deoxy-L-arabinose transferase-like glycosyltransferase